VVVSIYDDLGNPHYGGGGAAVVARVARRLADEYEVTVYCGSYCGAVSGDRDGVRYVHLPVGWAGPRGGQVLFSLLVPLLALVVRPDVWIESLTPPVSASLLPLVARCPVVGLVQMLCGADMQRRYGLPFEAVERRGLALYRHFVVLGDVDARLVAAASPRAQVTVIPNGMELPPAGDDVADGPVLFLGRIDVRQKGLDLLLEAVRADPDLRLDVAGSGTPAEMARLRELVADLGDRVRLLGRVEGEAKEALLRGCALMVVPSRYETFCLTALEAMAHGRPVVTFDLERLAWIGPGAGLTVPAFDAAALGAAMRRLLDDAALRAELGRGARARSLAFDRRIVEARYSALVAELLVADEDTADRPAPPGRQRLRNAESLARVSSESRATASARSRAALASAARWAEPVSRWPKTWRRTCSRVPLARSALYDSASPRRSSRSSSGSSQQRSTRWWVRTMPGPSLASSSSIPSLRNHRVSRWRRQ
jgi:glycosyltransferase involved in cell wall biosynthesis